MSLSKQIKAVLSIGIKDDTNKGLSSIRSNLHELQKEARKAAALPKIGPSLPPGLQRQRDLALAKSRESLRQYRKELRAELPAMRAAALRRSITSLERAAKRSAGKMRKHFRGAFRGLGRGAVIGGAAGGFAIKGMLDTANSFEKLRVTLETVEGSSEKAQKSFNWVSEFSKKTPFTLQETTDAFVRMKLRGMDPLNGSLEVYSDTAAAMASSGKRTTDVVEAIADAVTGENERLKEFGIKARKKGDFFVYSYDGKNGPGAVKALAKDSAGIRKALTGVLRSQFGGAGAALAKTMGGTLTNIGDHFSRFQNMVFASGVGGGIKSELTKLLEKLNEMEADGSMKKFAEDTSQALSDLLSILKETFNFFREAVAAVGGFRNALKIVGGFLAGKMVLQLGLAGAAALRMAGSMQAASALSGGLLGKFNALGALSGRRVFGGLAAFSFGALIGTWINEITGFDKWMANKVFEWTGGDGSGLKRFSARDAFNSANKAAFAKRGEASAAREKAKKEEQVVAIALDINTPPGVHVTAKAKSTGPGPGVKLNTGTLPAGGSL